MAGVVVLDWQEPGAQRLPSLIAFWIAAVSSVMPSLWHFQSFGSSFPVEDFCFFSLTLWHRNLSHFGRPHNWY